MDDEWQTLWERGGRLRTVQVVKNTPVTPATPAPTARAKAKAKVKSPQKKKKRVAATVKKRVGMTKVVKLKIRQVQAATGKRGRQRQRRGSVQRENAPFVPRGRISKEPAQDAAVFDSTISSDGALKLESESGVHQTDAGAATPRDETQQACSSSHQDTPPLQRIDKKLGEHKCVKMRTAVRHWVMTDGWPDEAVEPGKNGVHLSRSKVVEQGEDGSYESEGESGTPPEQEHATSTPALTENTQNFPHRSRQFQPFLKAQGVGLWGHPDGVVDEDIAVFRSLLEYDCETPRDTIFDNSTIFNYLCDRLHTRNKRELIVLVSKLLVPPAMDDHPTPLTSSRDAAWDCALALDAEGGENKGLEEGEDEGYDFTLFRARIPCPHYSVGFHATAFTQAQRDKLQPLLGGIFDTSYFKGTIHMLFPFFTAEAKDPDRLIEEAEAQTAHAMALALRGVVRLFQLVNREQDIHRRILGYSIAFNHSSVRIHAHYPVFTEEDSQEESSQSASSSPPEASYYRQALRKFDFTDPSGKERWTSYKFVMALYNKWVPQHHKRLCAVIDALPEPRNHEFSLASSALDFESGDDAKW